MVDRPFEAGEASLGRRIAAEFVGTLVFVAVGAGAATVLGILPRQRLSALEQFFGAPGQEEVFTALLGNSFSDLIPVALAFGFALAALVYAFGGVSGAHFNPAVTFALAVARRFRWVEVPLYWIAQCAGAIVGAIVIAGIYKEAGGARVFYGATTVAENVSFGPALLAEALIAFILMTAIMAVAVDPRAPKGWSGLVIALGLVAGILATGAATGGSANFARSLGPLVASTLFEGENVPWGDLGIYALGPVIGAAAAALIYESVTGLEVTSPAPRPGAATPPKEAATPTEADESRTWSAPPPFRSTIATPASETAAAPEEAPGDEGGDEGTSRP